MCQHTHICISRHSIVSSGCVVKKRILVFFELFVWQISHVDERRSPVGPGLQCAVAEAD